MPDTVKISIDTNKVNESIIRNIVYQLREKTGESLRKGYYKNLEIKIFQKHTTIRGSIAKYYTGSNLENLSRKDLQMGFEKLSDELNTDIRNGFVSRYDLGYNFEMEKPVIYYLMKLGTIARMEKSIYGNYSAVLYKNTLKSIQFYDKVKEAKIEFPNNLLRYELQFKKQLSLEFKGRRITVKMLYDPKFFGELLDKYIYYYFRIVKLNDLQIESNSFKNKKSLIKLLSNFAVNSIGIDELLAGLNAAKSDHQNKMIKYRLIKYILDSASLKISKDTDGLIQELDDKVQSVKQQFLN